MGHLLSFHFDLLTLHLKDPYLHNGLSRQDDYRYASELTVGGKPGDIHLRRTLWKISVEVQRGWKSFQNRLVKTDPGSSLMTLNEVFYCVARSHTRCWRLEKRTLRMSEDIFPYTSGCIKHHAFIEVATHLNSLVVLDCGLPLKTIETVLSAHHAGLEGKSSNSPAIIGPACPEAATQEHHLLRRVPNCWNWVRTGAFVTCSMPEGVTTDTVLYVRFRQHLNICPTFIYRSGFGMNQINHAAWGSFLSASLAAFSG